MCRWKFGLNYETHELVGGSEAYASKQSSASPFRIMTATTVALALAAAIAVEVTAATVVMNKSNRDNISRGAAAVLDSSSMIGAKDKRNRNR